MESGFPPAALGSEYGSVVIELKEEHSLVIRSACPYVPLRVRARVAAGPLRPEAVQIAGVVLIADISGAWRRYTAVCIWSRVYSVCAVFIIIFTCPATGYTTLTSWLKNSSETGQGAWSLNIVLNKARICNRTYGSSTLLLAKMRPSPS